MAIPRSRFLAVQLSLLCLTAVWATPAHARSQPESVPPPKAAATPASPAASPAAPKGSDAGGAPKLAHQADRESAMRFLQRVVGPAVEGLIEVVADTKANLDNRLTAMAILETMGPDAETAVPSLAQALSDRHGEIRLQAVKALAAIGPKAKAAVPELTTALKDGSESVRIVTANVLGKLGLDAKPAIPALIEALGDQSQAVRANAIYALSAMGGEAKAAVPDLTEALAESDPEIQKGAVMALGRMGADAQTAVPALGKLLSHADQELQLSVTTALGKIGPAAGAAVPDLVKLLGSNDRELRSFSAISLGKIGSAATAAIPDLTKALKDADKDVRMNAAAALGRIGAESKTALPALVETLQDANAGVRLSTGSALGKIAGGLQDKATTWKREDLTAAITALDKAVPLIDDPKNGFNEDVRAAVHRSLSVLKAEKESRLFDRSKEWVKAHPTWALLGLYATLAPLGWLGVLLWRPIWILKLNDLLKPYTDIDVPTPMGHSIKVPVRLALFVGFLHYHPRVLDAWVDEQLKTAADAFEHKNTVNDRRLYIPIPVVLKGNAVAELTSAVLRENMGTGRQCLLIWGEGGIGKTSLACHLAKWAMDGEPDRRLAKHRMLPVLIEQELDFKVPEGKDPLRETIRGQIQALLNPDETPSDELLEKLLKQRRILVIVDRFSELSEATREAIRPSRPNFPLNALIVTSRVEEALDNVPKTVIKPLRIEGNRLSSFLEAYLLQGNQRELFTDAEYFDACSQLSKMVGQRNVTVLLAKLYAEQMVASKQGNPDGRPDSCLPDNIPDLMLSYLNELNRDRRPDQPDHPTVHQVAKIIAGACLQQTYRPAPAKRDQILADLMTQTGAALDTAKAWVAHLEDRLKVIQTVGPAQDQLSFALDPLAECLAALNWVERYGEDADRWHQWLSQADGLPGDSIQGYLLAMRDCCIARSRDRVIPDFVLDELGRRVGLSAEMLRRTQVEQRLLRLTPQLFEGERANRLQAIRDLGELGPAAKTLVPALVREFSDSDWQVRQEVARTLGQIGPDARSALPALVNCFGDADRRVAVEAIASLGKLGAPALPSLLGGLQASPAYVRSTAAWVLSSFEAAAGSAVPALIGLLDDADWQVRWVAAYTLGCIGPEAKPAIPALIAACKGEYSLVAKEASRALWRINGEEAEAIVTALGTPQPALS